LNLEDLKEKVEKVQLKENELIVYVNQKNSSSLIMELLSSGLILRRMNSEDL